MNILKKFISAVSAAALAVSALTSVYAPLAYAEGYSVSETSSSSLNEDYSVSTTGIQTSSVSMLDLAEMGKSSKADFTLMVYMVGSDLESEYGAASEDIKEMCKGYKKSNVNIIIQTGGSTKWENTSISSKKCQRFQVTAKGLKLVDNSLGQQDMSSKNTLCNFVKYCKKQYPASRYGIILWDHGGGTIGGFGQDENYDSMMSILDMDAALSKGGVHFDFVGFDACLMATLEVAMLFSDYSDYLICPEYVSSALGWYYSDIIRAICTNPKITTLSLGKKVADVSVKNSVATYKYSTDEMSVIDLGKVRSTVLPALNTFSKNSLTFLESKKYSTVAKARSGLSIYSDAYELVDIYQYASSLSGESTLAKSAASLKNAVKKAVVYRKAAGVTASYGGLSITFPFYNLQTLDTLTEIYDEIDCDTKYTDFLIRFANIMAGGQQYHLGSDEKYNFSACDWYDESQFYHDNYYSRFYLGTADEDLPLQKINGKNVLRITDDMYEMISSYELCVYSGEKKGTKIVLTDYGTDNVTSFDGGGNLIVEFDKKWISLNGTPVTCYYDRTLSNGKYHMFLSCVFGNYNGQDAILYLMWDNNTFTYPDNGVIYAWSPIGEDGRISAMYYTNYNDKFTPYTYMYKNSKWGWYYTNNVFTIGKTKVTYEDISSSGTIQIFYKLTDIFNNVYYTDSVLY